MVPKLRRKLYENATFGRDDHDDRRWDDDAHRAALAHEQQERLALPGAREAEGGLMLLTYTDTTCRDGRHDDCPGSWEGTPAEIRCTCRCHWEPAFDRVLFPDDHPWGRTL